jgi:hypothetical protein
MRRLTPASSMPAVPLTEAALIAWFAAAPASARITYHRGFLAVDASALGGSSLPVPQRQDLQRVAGRAWRLAEAGLAHLLQRRHGDHDFAYLLEVRPRPPKLTPAQAKLLVVTPTPAMATDTPAEAAALAA